MKTYDPFESEIADLARHTGKFAAIARYRDVRGGSVRRARRAVEVILFQHGVPSMTPPRFFPWQRVGLLGGSIVAGLVIAGVLVALQRLFTDP